MKPMSKERFEYIEAHFDAGGTCSQEGAIELFQEVARLRKILDTPIVEPFVTAAVAEAAHQVYRWGIEHDAQKTAWDWFWTLGYLGGKAAQAALACDWGKAKHHTVTAAALLANWHAQIVEAERRG